MKFYRVSNADGSAVKWSTSSAGASAARAELVKNGAKRAEVETQEHEIGSTKAELLEWLNQNQI